MDTAMESAVCGPVDPLAIETPTNGNGESNDAPPPVDAVDVLMQPVSEVPEVASTEIGSKPTELKKMDQIEAPTVEKVDEPKEEIAQPEFVPTEVPEPEQTEAVPAVEATEVHVEHREESNVEEIIQAEMAEIHQEPPEAAIVDEASADNTIELHFEDSSQSANSEQDADQDEMILEETTGEYVLASSIKTKTEEVPEKKARLDVDAEVVKILEENFKSGDMQPGEQIVVVTSDEKGNTKEVVLTHTKTVSENGVTVQHVVDEGGEVYLIETVDSAEEGEEDEAVAVQTRPKRTPRRLQIPNHVLGRNIANPVEDTFRNGKAPPKPRLGVKIPYRNLTSQIVTKQEIAEEILERSRRFSRENPRQNLFARKLTQNLAKKLTPKETNASAGPAILAKRGRPAGSAKVRATVEKIDNSDLLAILEGDDGTTESTASNDTTEKEMTTEMEREIALKQLSELPEDPPKKPEDGESSEKKSEKAAKSPFTGSAPLKTYGRKRKTSEEVHYLTNPKSSASAPKQEKEGHAQKAHPKATSRSASSSSPEAPATASPRASRSNLPASPAQTPEGINYVTKSSRVIKRKVIWDPDEVSPKKGVKIDAPSTPTTTVRKEMAKKVTQEVQKDVKVTVAKRDDKEMKKPESPPKRTLERARAKEAKAPEQEKAVKEEPLSDSEEETPEKEKPSSPVKVKRLTEVSKLLMDEGAVNMLYSIKNDDAPSTRRAKKSQQSKAEEILNELSALHGGADRTSPKTLRKKDSLSAPSPAPKTTKKIMCPPTPSPISRQKSKDSNRSSVHSPPPSPSPAFGGVESQIIRRHSSSSYSSMGEEEDGEERRVKKLEGRTRRRAMQAAVDSGRKKGKVETPSMAAVAKPICQIKSKNDNFEKLVDIKLSPSEKYKKYKCFTVSSLNKLLQIDLAVNGGDEANVYLTNELMTELISILADLEADKGVNVVLITSQGSIFCNGLNFQSLVHPKEATRKSASKKLAKNISEFLLCLAKFPKVLAAGIHGDSFGIGVTMLPLFDTIIAHEEASFTIPNAKLGCVAEGGSLLLLPHLSRNVLVNELLYSSQTLSAEEALKLGLVTKILTKKAYAREVLTTVKGVSDKSTQFMVATKKQLRKRMIPDITNSLNDETENLIEQWTSEECQKSFVEYFAAE